MIGIMICAECWVYTCDGQEQLKEVEVKTIMNKKLYRKLIKIYLLGCRGRNNAEVTVIEPLLLSYTIE